MSDEEGKLSADDPRAGTVDDPNVVDPYADLKKKHDRIAGTEPTDATEPQPEEEPQPESQGTGGDQGGY